jgi:catechol 2,3-dioxygenase-like lactoylglutathione lyase family enzyme
MPVTTLQHVNIRCANAGRSRDFYQLLGLTEGPRPPFASTGYWMYAGDEPIVHLVQKKPDEPVLGPGTGALDHVALGAVNLAAMREELNRRGIGFREAVVPRDGSVQLFVADPDGVTLELNFPGPDR